MPRSKERVRHEDPTIAIVARNQFNRIRDRIETKLAQGVPFYVAREHVLAEEIVDVATAYGDEVARRVTREIEHMHPVRGLSAEGQAAKRQRGIDVLVSYQLAKSGRQRLPWWQRASIAVFGLPLI